MRSNVMYKSFTGIATAMLTALLSASVAHSQNLVTNSGFTAGNTGFLTSASLTFVTPTADSSTGATPPPTPNGYLQPDGLYAIAKNPSSHDNLAKTYDSNGVQLTGFDAHTNNQVVTSFVDHTDGTGNMLLINANNNIAGKSTAWQQDLTNLTVGQTYYFYASFAYWGIAGDAQNTKLDFAILNSGTGVDDYSAGNYLATSAVFNPPLPDANTTVPAPVATRNTAWDTGTGQLAWTATSTDATIRIENVNPVGGGYDYAIDDVNFSLQPVPAPPAMVSLMIGGMVGMVGTGAAKLKSRRKTNQKK